MSNLILRREFICNTRSILSFPLHSSQPSPSNHFCANYNYLVQVEHNTATKVKRVWCYQHLLTFVSNSSCQIPDLQKQVTKQNRRTHKQCLVSHRQRLCPEANGIPGLFKKGAVVTNATTQFKLRIILHLITYFGNYFSRKTPHHRSSRNTQFLLCHVIPFGSYYPIKILTAEEIPTNLWSQPNPL